MAKKKEKTVEEMIADYQNMHGKDFKKRIKKLEELHDPDTGSMKRIGLHAEYTIMGKPSDLKNYPGAYNEAYKVLDKLVENDTDKIDNTDELTKVFEKHVDTFLEKVVSERYKEKLEEAEKEGLSKEEIRQMKGNLFAKYNKTERGQGINILDEQYIKKLKGKKKIELIEELKKVAATNQKTYTMHLIDKATEHLITDEDHLDLHKYTTPLFEKAGFKHKDHPLTRTAEELANDYIALRSGINLSEIGYKRRKHKEGEKKGEIDFTPKERDYKKAA